MVKRPLPEASSVGAGPIAILAAFLLLFIGGAALGLWLAAALAPGSRVAEVVSFLALPIAFAAGLQAWYGLALLGLLPRLWRWLRNPGARADRARGLAPAELPGSWVFLPISSAAGAAAGLITGFVSSTGPVWLVLLAYWAAGTLHGLLAWRLARGGLLLPPESV